MLRDVVFHNPHKISGRLVKVLIFGAVTQEVVGYKLAQKLHSRNPRKFEVLLSSLKEFGEIRDLIQYQNPDIVVFDDMLVSDGLINELVASGKSVYVNCKSDTLLKYADLYQIVSSE